MYMYASMYIMRQHIWVLVRADAVVLSLEEALPPVFKYSYN